MLSQATEKNQKYKRKGTWRKKWIYHTGLGSLLLLLLAEGIPHGGTMQ